MNKRKKITKRSIKKGISHASNTHNMVTRGVFGAVFGSRKK